MMWGYYGGWSPLWMLIPMLIFWGGLAVLVVWGVRAFGRSRPHEDGAVETLRRRFAAGEISQEEYEKIRRTLQG